MTDDTQTSTDSATTETEEPVVVVAAAVGDEAGIVAEAAIAVQGDHALILARFADTDAAKAAYEGLREAEAARAIHIDAVLVVNADASGKVHIQKMTDHSTRTGFKWGVVAGVVVGVIFPPSILASAAAVGVAGAAVGKIGNELKRSEVADSLTEIITPGSSGILALVDITAVPEVTKDLGEATAVKTVPVSAETADAIKEAAGKAEPEPVAATSA